jgi:hypothetical protein
VNGKVKQEGMEAKPSTSPSSSKNEQFPTPSETKDLAAPSFQLRLETERGGRG